MSNYDSSLDNLNPLKSTTPSFIRNDGARSFLDVSSNFVQELNNIKPTSSVLPPVSFHSQTNPFPGAKKAASQSEAAYTSQVEQLALWKNHLALLEAHTLEHKIQLDIAQNPVRAKTKNLAELNSSLIKENEKLREDLFEIYTKISTKEKALESINSAIHFTNKVHSEENHGSEFQRAARKLQALDMEAMNLSNELSEKERKLFQIEEKIAAEAGANRQRFERLEELKLELAEKERSSTSKTMNSFASGNPKPESTSDRIKLKKRHILTLQHLISGLALSSSVEWHLDPELQEAMLDPIFPKDI